MCMEDLHTYARLITLHKLNRGHFRVTDHKKCFLLYSNDPIPEKAPLLPPKPLTKNSNTNHHLISVFVGLMEAWSLQRYFLPVLTQASLLFCRVRCAHKPSWKYSQTDVAIETQVFRDWLFIRSNIRQIEWKSVNRRCELVNTLITLQNHALLRTWQLQVAYWHPSKYTSVLFKAVKYSWIVYTVTEGIKTLVPWKKLYIYMRT